MLALCAVALFALPSLTGSAGEQALARIVVNSQVQPVTGFATSEARQYMLEDGGLDIEVKADGSIMTVNITVKTDEKGDEALEQCAKVANSIADKAVAMAEYMYEDNANKENVTAFRAQIEYADPETAEAIEGGGKVKYLLVALIAGLFIALCVVVIIDIVRRPVKSIEGAQNAVDLPVLEKLPVADGGERLLANVRFASKADKLSSVCVVPVGMASVADEACVALAQAATEEGVKVSRATVSADAKAPLEAPVDALTVVSCESFAKGMGAAYAAKGADAVVLAVCQWSDSLKELESAAAELKLADTNLVGLVFAPEAKK